jgi:hypothetical protein
MTVKELINKLLDAPMDANVTVMSDPEKRAPDEEEFDIAGVKIISNQYAAYVEIRTV